MSRKINVNPDHYKVAGRERQGHDVVHEVEKQEIKRARGGKTPPFSQNDARKAAGSSSESTVERAMTAGAEEGPTTAMLARDVMTPDPACCTRQTTLDEVAKLMILKDCGEIPVIDSSDQLVGVITDRDIVCRAVAEGKNPVAHTAEQCMSHPVVTVPVNAPLDEVMSTMEKHRIRRVPVVDGDGCCVGIIAQADVALTAPARNVTQLVREVSRDSARRLH
jgi:CBS domain-containing protein